MILYLDSSAYLKLYVEEAESAWLRQAIMGSPLCCHVIGYAEMRAGFAKAERMGRLSTGEHAYQLGLFEQDWKSTRIVQIDETSIRHAGDLAQHFGLRGYDSVHLAAAEAVWRALPGVDYRCAVFDGRLADAARALGLTVLD
jgi:predicted nucleic acid-binding protein